MVGGRELTRLYRAEGVAHEIDLTAGPGRVIEIEQKITNRALFQRSYQRGQTRAIVERNRGDFRDFEPADGDKAPRQILARKGQRPGPRMILFLEGVYRAVAIEQEVQLSAVEGAHAASILSSPRR